jgi:hypothetical protein
MPETPQPAWFDDLWSDEPDRRQAAYEQALADTVDEVAWAEEVWDETVERLTDDDNHTRSIAAQVLCHLARSAPDRAAADLPSIVEVTHDERFVTARHTLQAMWRVGLAGETCRARVTDTLETRFLNCGDEKNSTLIRNDIVEALGRIHRIDPNAGIDRLVTELIGHETDAKYRTKYERTWRSALR